MITNITNTGTAIILQANNDIILNAGAALISNNPSGNGGDITLQAGRSMLLNDNITTDNGALTLIANDWLFSRATTSGRDPGKAVITMAGGTTIDAGTGIVEVTMRNGAGSKKGSDDIALRDIKAGALIVRNSGRKSERPWNLFSNSAKWRLHGSLASTWLRERVGSYRNDPLWARTDARSGTH